MLEYMAGRRRISGKIRKEERSMKRLLVYLKDYKNYFEAVINDKRFPALKEKIERAIASINNSNFKI